MVIFNSLLHVYQRVNWKSGTPGNMRWRSSITSWKHTYLVRGENLGEDGDYAEDLGPWYPKLYWDKLTGSVWLVLSTTLTLFTKGINPGMKCMYMGSQKTWNHQPNTKQRILGKRRLVLLDFKAPAQQTLSQGWQGDGGFLKWGYPPNHPFKWDFPLFINHYFGDNPTYGNPHTWIIPSK